VTVLTVLTVLVLAGSGLWWNGRGAAPEATGSTATAFARVETPRRAEPPVPPRVDPDAPARASRGGERDGAEAMATVAGLELHAPHEDPVVVAFHEALAGSALPLAPTGRLTVNDHPTWAPPTGAEGREGAPYRVLATRGREGTAASAVDVVVPDGATVTAPVTGTVSEVRDYALYGEHPDVRVAIRPDDAPRLEVVLVHLEDPVVAAGDRVVVGGSPLARARSLPFSSHVDAFTPEPLPHTHLEVKRVR